jgi:hypothetical protein
MKSLLKSATRWAACAALIAAVGACKEDKPADAGGKGEPEKTEKPVEKKELSELFEGDKPGLVGPLAKLELEQPGDAAKKAAPEIFETKYGILDSEQFEGVSFSADVDEKTGKLERVSVKLPKAKALDAVKKAWGEPKEATDTIGKQELTWFNPETGVRAVLKEGFGDDMDLEFTKYMPAKQLVGEGKDKFGFEKKSMLGLSIDELRAEYGDQLVEKSAAEAQKDREKLEKFAGRDLKELGEAKPNAYIELLPTEWESYWTRVNPSFDDANKVQRYTFDLSYRAFPAAKDELLGLLKAKFGEPKEFEEYGRKKLLFSESPRVEVEDNDIVKAWDVTVEKGAEAPTDAPAEAPAP